MKRICSYCRKDLGEVPPLDDDSLTHGMCIPCLERFSRQWEGQSLDEYLDRFDDPVLVVNEDRRVVAVNQAMTRMLNRPAEALTGLLGGEAMECKYAALPEGCGATVHCKTCTIRLLVERCRDTGERVTDEPASLYHPDGEVQFLVSTERHESGIVVRVKSVE